MILRRIPLSIGKKHKTTCSYVCKKIESSSMLGNFHSASQTTSARTSSRFCWLHPIALGIHKAVWINVPSKTFNKPWSRDSVVQVNLDCPTACRTPRHHVQLEGIFYSGNFKDLTDLLTSKNMSVQNFYPREAHKTSWNSREKFKISKHMRAELDLLTSMSKSPIALRS